MPHEWNNLMVVTKDELVPNWFTWDNLKKTIDRYKDRSTGIKRVQLGGNGRVMLIDFDTLPLHVQHGLGDPRLVKHVFEKYYRNDKDAVRFFNQFRFDDGSYLDIEYQERYVINANVIQAALCLKTEIEKQGKKKGKAITGIFGTLCNHAISFNKTLATKHKYEHTLPGSEKHFKIALNKFESHGYKSLISGKHGNSNSRKVYENTISLLEAMFGRDTTKPTATEIHRVYSGFLSGTKEVVNDDTGELYNPADFKELSDTTVKAYLSAWQSKIGTHALRSGDRQKLMGAFKPYHSLDKPKHAGSLLSIDDRQPPFKMADGERVWFYMGIDLASEAFTCWVHGKSKKGIIKEFYQQLLRNYHDFGFNLPDGLEAEMSLNSSYVNTFLREGAMFQNVRIEANNARGKQIERYFGELRYRVEKKREGWLARPYSLSESNQPGAKEVPTLTYEEIVNNCLEDIETWNNMPHSVHTHLSRWEVFTQMQNPKLLPTNYNGILPHLGHRRETSCKTGIIKLHGGEYLLGENGKVCLGAPLISLLEKVEGEQVEVYWIDSNEDGTPFKALVYQGGLLICEAVKKPTYNRAVIERTPQCLINYEIMSSYVSTIEAYGRRRKMSIESVTIIDRTPPTPKTFIMPGLKRNTVSESNPGGLLPDPDTIVYEMPVQSFVRDLKDRF